VEAVMCLEPGESYAENLRWDLKVYVLCKFWCDNLWHDSVAIELEPGTYYLEGHAGYLKLTTPLLKVTILETSSE
jgi:hypothetical protein